MQSRIGGLAVLILATLSIGVLGCGGSSTEARDARFEVARGRVQRSFGLGLNAMALSGAQSPFQADRRNGAANGGPEGGNATFSMMGGFMRHVAFTNAGVPRPDDGDDGGSSGGGTGWGGEPGFYFDEWLGLWVDVQITETRVAFLLYEDEARARPAGSIVSTFPADPAVFPQTYASTYEIRAGFLNGSHGSYEVTLESEIAGTMAYENTYPGFGKDQGAARWDASGSTWSSRYEEEAGFWSSDSGTFLADGSGTTLSENAWGYRLRFEYHADGSGAGRIEGPDPGLPATVTWDAEGNGRIVWADGTVETFNWGWCVAGSTGTGASAPPGP
ncbi:MAG: hypothetical protein KIS66_08995 [Fimbriimonadaceae bacterium]|nr:hypothetical protein [Fimbriimonadaceae bacterium]